MLLSIENSFISSHFRYDSTDIDIIAVVNDDH